MAGRVLRSAKYRFHNPTALDELCRLIPLSHRFDLFTLQRYIQAQAITYIPLSNASKRRRGFNQSEHIAQYLGAILNLPVCALVTKVTETPNQASLDKKARAQTRNHMFRASSKGLRSVYLVDDVITTGATMRAAAQALHNAGITSIYGITLCRS
ncbi:hypothetical protein COU89_02755 [Candidatus Roizmanbacteria bacterium CG10_big_fil_rev_8_21_14_0_10_45_7]|uniref:Phosphoribosyltransferase domain-containing protein n=1 Tax=Candidatus Roizmanbacteria bacterium CG10_big_fil_rev_8_21_14_0_10_45_7 TaxID=1974854 RepID=A0A2M8KUF5_9BACT|nr:MAG: hypothetical protein COU89_02755 [Candidatus Roizmanbacteria bacterium CG10_big_fil_rev_8_21_14_0_10_45_7]